MSNTSVFCIAISRGQAETITDRLKAASFSNTDISVLFPDKGTTRDFAHEMHTKAPEGAAAGGVIGGALGWIAGIAALAIPGFGAFLAAGPVMVALSGAAVGAAVGGVTGGLIGLGIPEIQAKCYEGKVKAGNFLLAVHTENPVQIAQAKAIFTAAGAQDICATCESSVPGGAQAGGSDTSPRSWEPSGPALMPTWPARKPPATHAPIPFSADKPEE